MAQTTEALDGKVSVDSTLGRGSTFTVCLPIKVATGMPNQPAPAPMAPLQVPAPGGLQVLVVDDNEINRIVLGDMVKSLGHVPTIAVDGEGALEIAGKIAFDLILMDISMPGLDGTQVSAQLRSWDGPNRDTRIVAQTAHARPEDHDSFAEAGISGVLIKPVTQEKLQACIAQDAQSFDTAMAPGAHVDLGDVLDKRQFAQFLAAAGEERAAILIQDVLADAEQILSVMGSASDVSAQIADVHQVAGASASLGASYLNSQLAIIERRLKEGQTEGLEDLISNAQAAVVLTRMACAQPPTAT